MARSSPDDVVHRSAGCVHVPYEGARGRGHFGTTIRILVRTSGRGSPTPSPRIGRVTDCAKREGRQPPQSHGKPPSSHSRRGAPRAEVAPGDRAPAAGSGRATTRIPAASRGIHPGATTPPPAGSPRKRRQRGTRIRNGQVPGRDRKMSGAGVLARKPRGIRPRRTTAMGNCALNRSNQFAWGGVFDVRARGVLRRDGHGHAMVDERPHEAIAAPRWPSLACTRRSEDDVA